MLLGIGASVTDTAVTYFEFMKHNIVFVPFIFIMAWLLTKMFKPEKPIDGKAFFMEEQRKLGKMSMDELKTAIAMIALFLCMLTNIVDIGFAFVIIPCLLFFPGINVGVKEDMAKINYGFLIFVTACMSIGSVAMCIRDRLGGVIATLLSGLLAGISWRASFLVYLLGLVSIVLCLFFLPNDHIQNEGETGAGENVGSTFKTYYPYICLLYTSG